MPFKDMASVIAGPAAKFLEDEKDTRKKWRLLHGDDKEIFNYHWLDYERELFSRIL